MFQKCDYLILYQVSFNFTISRFRKDQFWFANNSSHLNLVFHHQKFSAALCMLVGFMKVMQ